MKSTWTETNLWPCLKIRANYDFFNFEIFVFLLKNIFYIFSDHFNILNQIKMIFKK